MAYHDGKKVVHYEEQLEWEFKGETEDEDGEETEEYQRYDQEWTSLQRLYYDGHDEFVMPFGLARRLHQSSQSVSA